MTNLAIQIRWPGIAYALTNLYIQMDEVCVYIDVMSDVQDGV